MNSIRYLQHESPIGLLRLAASEHGLSALYMDRHRHVPEDFDSGWTAIKPSEIRQSRVLDTARRQIDEYFDGRRTAFDLPLDPIGTDFQRGVWRGLCTIGYGETISY